LAQFLDLTRELRDNASSSSGNLHVLRSYMKNLLLSVSSYVITLSLVSTSLADVTIKQRVTMSGQKFESTKRIKGSRERTEQHMEMADPAMAAYMPQIATITQCDLKRRIQINDRKRLYFIEPFETPEPEAAARPARPAQPATTGPTRKGGTLTMTYNVRDTGERKMMFGLQARHIITTQEMESSADSCNGPVKTKYEFDGWYVDFAADFSCPTAAVPYTPGGRMPKPDCIDRVVTRGSGTAPRGMMLEGTMKIYGADGSVQMTQTTETLELNRDPLDASLFDIPQGYQEAASSQDLYAVTMPTFGQPNGEQPNTGRRPVNPMMPPAAARTVALNISGAGTNQPDVEAYVRGKLAEKGLRVVSGTADYTVNINFRQIKESTAGKIGGIFGKVTGAPTGGVGKVDIDLIATLSGKMTANGKVKEKFDGPLSAALRLALDQALDPMFETLER
jgi:hypothetical protein